MVAGDLDWQGPWEHSHTWSRRCARVRVRNLRSSCACFVLLWLRHKQNSTFIPPLLPALAFTSRCRCRYRQSLARRTHTHRSSLKLPCLPGPALPCPACPACPALHCTARITQQPPLPAPLRHSTHETWPTPVGNTGTLSPVSTRPRSRCQSCAASCSSMALGTRLRQRSRSW